MMAKCLRAVIIALVLGPFCLRFAQAESGVRLYSVVRSGTLTGYLGVFWDGAGVLQGTFRDPSGIVLFQDRYDHGHYMADTSQTTGLKHLEVNVNSSVIPFTLKTIHHLFLAQHLFPKNEGISVHLTMLEPNSGKQFTSKVEWLGFKILNDQNNRVKLKHYFLKSELGELHIYLDQTGEMVNVEVPSDQTEFRLTNAEVATYPVEPWELLQKSECCKSREIQIQAADGDVLNSKFFVPAHGSGFPGALIVGPPESLPFLNMLAYNLAGKRAVAAIVYAHTQSKDATGKFVHLDSIYRFFRRQQGIDPGRMFVIGFDTGVEDAAVLLANRKDIKAGIFLSPETVFLEGLSTAVVPHDNPSRDFNLSRVALLIMQGENDFLRSLEKVRQWSAAVNMNEKSQRVEWVLVPGVGHDFLAKGELSSKFSELNLERSANKGIFDAIDSWLVLHGLAH